MALRHPGGCKEQRKGRKEAQSTQRVFCDTLDGGWAGSGSFTPSLRPLRSLAFFALPYSTFTVKRCPLSGRASPSGRNDDQGPLRQRLRGDRALPAPEQPHPDEGAALVQAEPQRWAIVDASQAPLRVQEAIRQIVAARLGLTLALQG